MPQVRSLFILAISVAALLSAPVTSAALLQTEQAEAIRHTPLADTAFQLPGREDDARVARIAFRLATNGRARCANPVPATGMVLQHLSQFRAADRPGMIATLALDRGPAVIAIVPGSPAAIAGIHTQDVLLSVEGADLPRESSLPPAFDPARAHARADFVADMLARSGTKPFNLVLLRDGRTLALRVVLVSACAGQVELARSAQRNAYADSRHVFLPTGLVEGVRSDDELAFVIAHEMAHVILGHAAIMRSDKVSHGLGRTLGESGRMVRDTERQADTLGGRLMLDAGYDPVVGAAILGRLDVIDIGLFAAHDTSGSRIARMRALVAERQVP